MDDEGRKLEVNAPQNSVETIMDIATDVGAGVHIPKPLRKTFWKAVSRLSTAAIDVPISILEGKANEIRSESEARIKLIETGAGQIAEQMSVSQKYAEVAVSKFAQKILREQINVDKIVEETGNILSDANNADNRKAHHDKDIPNVDDDFLNEFENIAKLKTAKEIRTLFSRILAAEISVPETISTKALKIAGEMDKNALVYFQSLCSLSIAFEDVSNGQILDIRVPTVGDDADQNGLSQFGLSFEILNRLNEYGLIIGMYSSYFDYGKVVEHRGKCSFVFGDKPYYFEPIGDNILAELKVYGVALTAAGRELSFAMEKNIAHQPSFLAVLRETYKAQGFKLVDGA